MNANDYNNTTVFSVYVAPKYYDNQVTLVFTVPCQLLIAFQSHYLILFYERFGHVERSFVLVTWGIMTPWSLRHHGRNVDQSDDECTAHIGMHGISGQRKLPSFVFCRFYPPPHTWNKRIYIILPWISRPLKVGEIRCPETSINRYHHTLRNNAQERRPQI